MANWNGRGCGMNHTKVVTSLAKFCSVFVFLFDFSCFFLFSFCDLLAAERHQPVAQSGKPVAAGGGNDDDDDDDDNGGVSVALFLAQLEKNDQGRITSCFSSTTSTQYDTQGQPQLSVYSL